MSNQEPLSRSVQRRKAAQNVATPPVKSNIRHLIEQAKQHLDDDPHLANYILRDTQEVKDADLSALAWAIHKGSPHKNDVKGLIDHLEKYLAQPPAGDAVYKIKERLDSMSPGERVVFIVDRSR